MKYMLIMRSTPEADAAGAEIPFEEIIEAMGKYNESLIEAGVLLSAEGLAPVEEGFVVDFDSTPPVISDGPYAEAKELFNGFWIIETATKEEAAEWASRCPLGPGVKLEVRRVQTLDEFDQDNEYIQREAEWRESNDAASTN
ncbi:MULTISPECIES: YciI family protein [unclassified Plantibacter]|uniref:YciI family protein n=1 Tax=unclassified Plantibacter TaxID=2624265 RepID=UPI003D32489E